MRIAVKDIENFLTNIPKSIKAILLYGPNNGLIKIRTNFLINTRELIADYNYDLIKNNPYILLDKFNSISIFNNNSNREKIILIESNSTSINEAVTNFIKESNYSGLLIFYTNELGTDSSLRRFFENNNNVAAIACYQDDNLAISKIIFNFFRERKVNISSNIATNLINYLPFGDRMLILNELEKIYLFLAEKDNFSLEDLEHYLELQGEVSFDKLCFQISLKQIQNIDLHIDKLQNEGHNLVAIIRILIRHFYRLHQVKQIISQGKTEQQALETLTPPIFFKQQNYFSRSLGLWSIEELQNLLSKLTKAELLAKKNPTLAELNLKSLFIYLIKV